MQILFPQTKLEQQDYTQKPVHTLCTQMNFQTGPFFVHSVRGSDSPAGSEKEEQVAGPEMTVPPVMPIGHSQQPCWHRDLLASQHRLLSALSPIFSLFSLLKDCYKTSMSQICALWFLYPKFLRHKSKITNLLERILVVVRVVMLAVDEYQVILR